MTELQQDPQQVDAADDSDCFWFPNLAKCADVVKPIDPVNPIDPAPIQQEVV